MTSGAPGPRRDRPWLLAAAALVVTGTMGVVSIRLPVWLYPQRPRADNLGLGVLLGACVLFIALGVTAAAVVWVRRRSRRRRV